MSILTRMFRIHPPYEPPETRDWSIGDPATAQLLGFGLSNLSGVSVSEHSVLGLPAVWRAVSLISGSIASLPMRTIATGSDGTTARSTSFLDDPAGPDGITPYEWKETVLTHLLVHGNAFLRHVYGGAGQLLGLQPIHPSAVAVDCRTDGTVTYKVTLADGKVREFNRSTMTHVPALSTDGIRGLSPLQVARNSFGTSIAAERSASKLFSHGALMSGIVTPEDELSEEDAGVIRDQLSRNTFGHENAGGVAVINRKLKFSPWSISPEDLQWIESRSFQIEEVARWFGIPPHLLAQTEKQTSWGTGVSEQNRGYARYTLEPWTTRVQERLTRLLPAGRKCEFDYTALVQPDPETEIRLLIDQVNAGLLTVSEARRIRNLPPLPEQPRQQENK